MEKTLTGGFHDAIDPRKLQLKQKINQLIEITNQRFVDQLLHGDHTFNHSTYAGMQKLLDHSGLSDKYNYLSPPSNLKMLCNEISSLQWDIKNGPSYKEQQGMKKAKRIAQDLLDKGELKITVDRTEVPGQGITVDYGWVDIYVGDEVYRVAVSSRTTSTRFDYNKAAKILSVRKK